MKKVLKKFNYLHLIAIAITISFLLLSVFVYKNSFIRIKETGYDLYTSFVYNFQTLSNSFVTVPSSVTKISSIDISFLLPVDWETFTKAIELTWKALFTEENLFGYLEKFSDVYLILITLAELILIIVLLLKRKDDQATEVRPLAF